MSVHKALLPHIIPAGMCVPQHVQDQSNLLGMCVLCVDIRCLYVFDWIRSGLCLTWHHTQASNMQNIKGEDGDVFLNNHVDIDISYHESSEFIVCKGGRDGRLDGAIV